MHRENARRAGLARAMLLLPLVLSLAIAWPAPAIAARARFGQASTAASPVSGETVEFAGLLDRPASLTVDELQALPTETIDVTYETRGGPEQHTFTGTRLYGVLDSLGFTVGAEERSPLLTRYVVVTAKDGYRVVLSGGELDPGFGNAPMLLAWEQDGAPLVGDDGPIRLVAPGDTRGGRYVYGVVRIEVVGLPSA